MVFLLRIIGAWEHFLNILQKYDEEYFCLLCRLCNINRYIVVVCVCVRERERERECVCVYVCMYVSARVCVVNASVSAHFSFKEINQLHNINISIKMLIPYRNLSIS
jgi:hypothetical protein